MPRLPRSIFLLWLAATALVAVGLGTLAWRWGSDVADTVQEYFHQEKRLREIRASAKELDAGWTRQSQRIRAKDRIALDLIDGRISLAEAGRRLDALPDAPPHFHELLRQREGGATEEENCRRHMLDYACTALEGDPIRQAALRRRLTAELASGEPH